MISVLDARSMYLSARALTAQEFDDLIVKWTEPLINATAMAVMNKIKSDPSLLAEIQQNPQVSELLNGGNNA